MAFLTLFFSVGGIMRAEMVAGDPNSPLVSRAGTEFREAVMVIDEGHPIDLSAAPNSQGVLREFRFVVGQATGRVTPFVVRRLGDNSFTVRAIGKTRVVGVDYTREDVGKVVRFPFSEEPEPIRMDDGWLVGFISANADGTEAGVPPIPFDATGNEIWISGGQLAGDSGSVRVSAAPTRGSITELENILTYAFQITAIASEPVPVAPVELTTTSNFMRGDALTEEPVATLIAVDQNIGDQLSFQLVVGSGDDDNGLFEVAGTQLLALDELPGEVRDYSVRVRVVDDDGLALESAITLQARLPLPPTAITLDSLEIPLGSISGRRFAFMAAEDPNTADFGDFHQFDLVAGEGDLDNGLFAVFENRLLWLGGAVVAGQEYSIRLRATDRTGLSFEQNFTVFGQALGRALVGNAVTGRSTSRSDVTPAFYSNFAPMPSAGIVDAVEIYFQGQPSTRLFNIFQLRLEAEGGFEVVYDSGAIAPDGIQDEAVRLDFPNGTTVVQEGDIFAHFGTGIPLNIGGTVSNTGDNFFPVFIPTEQPMQGNRIELPGPVFQSSGGPFRDYAWAVHFAPTVPLAPTGVVLNRTAVAASALAGSVVSRLSADDQNPNEVHGFELTAGDGDDDNALFEIDGDELLLAGEAPVESQLLRLRLRVTDSDGLSLEEVFVVSVLEPLAPTAILTEEPVVFSGVPSGEVLLRLIAVDANIAHGDQHQFELIEGFGDDDNDRLLVVGDQLLLGGELGAELLRFRVRVTDSDGLSFERALVVPIAQLLGGAIEPRESGGEVREDVFFTNFLPVPEPGVAYGVSRWQQGGAGEFSIVQMRVAESSDNIYNVIHSSGSLTVDGGQPDGVVNQAFRSDPSRVEVGDLFGSYGNGLAFSEQGAPTDEFVPIYFGRLRPTRPNIITLGSPAFRFSPRNSRNYGWAVQWLPDSLSEPDPDQDGDGLPDVWELEAFGDLSEDAFGDRDQDGIANLLEFYEFSELNLVVGDGEIVASYPVRDLPEIENRLFVEWSSDLKTWVRAEGTVDVTSSEVQVTFPFPEPDEVYLRLRAVP